MCVSLSLTFYFFVGKIMRLIVFMVTVPSLSRGDVFEKPSAYSTGIDPAKDLIPQDYNGVMSGINDMSEDASFRRYTLLNKLINNEPKLRTAASNMYAQLTNMYNVLKTKQSGVDNITQVIDADASAGGIRATVSSLRDQIPQSSKMLRKMVDTLFKNLATDSMSINRTLSDTEEDYRARIKRSADTISAMLVSLDTAFARSAYAQANAMKRSAGELQSQFAPEIQSTQYLANGVLAGIRKTSERTNKGVSKISLGLSDASEMPMEIETSHQSSLSAVTAQLQQLLNKQQDQAQKSISTVSDRSMMNVEKSGMKMAKSVENVLNQIQSQLIANVTTIESEAAKKSKQISQDAGRYSRKILGNLSGVQGEVRSNLTAIQSWSDKVQTDSVEVVTDSRNMLNEFDESISRTSSDFTVDSGKLAQSIPSHIQGVLGEAARVASSVNRDLTNELSRQNSGIASLVDTADSVASTFGAVIETPMVDLQRSLSDSMYRSGANIKTAKSLADQNTQLVSANVDAAVDEHGQRLSNLNALMSGGIEELRGVISESGDSNSAGLDEIRTKINSKSSEAFMNILEKVHGQNTDSNEALSEFISTVMTPNRDRTEAELGQLASGLSSLLTSKQSIADTQSKVWNSAMRQHKNRLGKMKQLGNDVSALWDRNGAIVDSIKSNASEVLGRLKNFIRETSANELVSNSEFAKSGLDRIRRLLDSSIADFWTHDNSTGAAVAQIGAKIDGASSALAQLRGYTDKGVAKVGSVAASLVARLESQRKDDLKQSKVDVGRFQKNLISSLRDRVVRETDAGLSEVVSVANSNKKRSNVVKDLMTKLKSHVSEIEKDFVVASNVNGRRVADTDRAIGLVAGKVNEIRGSMESSFGDMQREIQDQIMEKSNALNVTEHELNGQLGKLEEAVNASSETLEKNLLMYQGKIEGIINQIKSYMNLSSAADELAIRNGIAKELAAINSTAVQFAAMRSGVDDRMAASKSGRISRELSNSQILGNLIGAAEGVAGQKKIAEESNREKLIAVGLDVDAKANALRSLVTTGTSAIENSIAESRRKNDAKLKSAKGVELKRYSQIEEKSRDVAEKARSEFFSQVGKMAGFDDNIALTSKQLEALIRNSNSTLSDISTSVMNHMDLSVATQARLNEDSHKRIASIGDVLGIFSSVITGFVSEIELGMRTIMSDMDAIDSWSAKKMGEMKTRSEDELGWLKSGIEKVKDKFSAEIEAEKTIQDSLMAGLLNNNETIAQIETRYQAEAKAVHDRIVQEEQRVRSFGPSQINKVRQWMNNKKRSVLSKKT